MISALRELLRWAELGTAKELTVAEKEGEELLRATSPRLREAVSAQTNQRVQILKERLRVIHRLQGVYDPTACPLCGSDVTFTGHGVGNSVTVCNHCGRFRADQDFGETTVAIWEFNTGFSYKDDERKVWAVLAALGAFIGED